MARPFWKLLLTVQLLLACHPSVSHHSTIGFLVRMHQSDGTKMGFDFTKLAACGILAVRHVNSRDPVLVPDAENVLPDLNLTYVLKDTMARPSAAAEQANALAVDMGVDAILGPGRSAEVGPVAIVAGAHDVPSISYAASSSQLSDETTYRLFSRTAFTEKAKANVVMQICVDMGWRRLAILYRKDLWGSDVQSLLLQSASDQNVVVAGVIPYFYQDAPSIDLAVRQLAETGAHIFVFVAGMEDLEEIAFAAGENKIMGQGYVWMNVGGLEHPGGKIQSSRDPARLQQLVAGVIDVKDAPFYGNRAKEFEDAFSKVEVSDVYHPAMDDLEGRDPRKGPFPYTCANLYDAVWAVAFGISKAFEEMESRFPGEDVRLNGGRISEFMRTTSFKGAGGLVAFDEATGDRYQDGASFEVRSWIPISDDNGSPTVDPTVIAVQHVGTGVGMERVNDPYWPGGSRSWAEVPGDSACPAGTEASPLTGNCQACPAGTTSDGSYACTPCPKGHYAPSDGSITCIPCSSGYADQEGQATCTRCPGVREIPPDQVQGARALHQSVEECLCPEGYILDCKWQLWRFLVTCLAALLALLGVVLLLWWIRKRRLLDWEDKLVLSELNAVRKRLFITPQDGFLMPGEWRSLSTILGLEKREYTCLSRNLVFNVVRLSLLLNFEPLSIDVLCTLFKLIFLDAHPLRASALADAAAANSQQPTPPREESNEAEQGLKQLQALSTLVLEVSQSLLGPSAPSAERRRREEEIARFRSQSAEERYHYFHSKVWKLRLWDDCTNRRCLAQMAQAFLESLRKECDKRSREMLLEEGGAALAAWGSSGLTLPLQLDPARQDHSLVGAIRVDDDAKTEMAVQFSQFLRRASTDAPPLSSAPSRSAALSLDTLAATASSAQAALRRAPSDTRSTSPQTPLTRRLRAQRQKIMSVERANSDGSIAVLPESELQPATNASSQAGSHHLEGGALEGGGGVQFPEAKSSAQRRAPIVASTPPSHATPLHPPPASSRAPSSSPRRSSSPLSLAFLRSTSLDHPSSPPASPSPRSRPPTSSPRNPRDHTLLPRDRSPPLDRSPPPRDRSPRASLTLKTSPLQQSRPSRTSLAAQVERVERLSSWQNLDQQDRGGGSGCKGDLRLGSRAESGQMEWTGVDEEIFVVQLRRRATLLNEGFQQHVRDLVVGGKQVYAGPIKSKHRMLDLVEQRGRDGPVVALEGLPFAADILDPVRASVVCQSPQDILQLAEWLVHTGESNRMAVVKVRNRFAAGDVDRKEGGNPQLTLHVLFTSSSGLSIIGEIQLHDPVLHSLNVKMHRLETVQRAAAASARRESGELGLELDNHHHYKALLEDQSLNAHDLDSAIADISVRSSRGPPHLPGPM